MGMKPVNAFNRRPLLLPKTSSGEYVPNQLDEPGSVLAGTSPSLPGASSAPGSPEPDVGDQNPISSELAKHSLQTQQHQRPHRDWLVQLRHPLGLLLLSCGIAFWIEHWLTQEALRTQQSAAADLMNTLILLGLDTQRALLVGSLLFCLIAGIMGAMVGWGKGIASAFGALLGALLGFSFSYVLPFVQLEQLPVRNPAGALEPLNQAGLTHNVLVLLALGLVCGFAGAGVGTLIRLALLLPFLQLCWMIGSACWQLGKLLVAGMFRYPTHLTWRGTLYLLYRPNLWAQTTVAVTLLGAAMLAFSGARLLLLYSPDYGVHQTAPLPIVNGGKAEPGKVIEASYISPALHGQRRQFALFLPPFYNNPVNATRRYPVLYVLHGMPGSSNNWFTAGQLADSANQLIARYEIADLIIVAPDGNGRPGASPEWGNSADGQQRLEDAIAFDLVSFIDSHYRTLASAPYRAIGGLSTGGVGSMNIAAHHPDLFGSVISLGGYYQAEGPIWGTQLADRQQNSPLYVFPRRSDDWGLAIFLGAADKDQPYYDETKAFAAELDSLHVPYHLDVQPGQHAWKVWAQQMWNALLWLHGNDQRW
jgi:enterochelin esterase-like enzyme